MYKDLTNFLNEIIERQFWFLILKLLDRYLIPGVEELKKYQAIVNNSPPLRYNIHAK